jgi:uncharacterized membrane protein
MIAYFILGNFSMSGTIAVIQLICNTILYYVHERVWNNIGYGRFADIRKNTELE